VHSIYKIIQQWQQEIGAREENLRLFAHCSSVIQRKRNERNTTDEEETFFSDLLLVQAWIDGGKGAIRRRQLLSLLS